MDSLSNTMSTAMTMSIGQDPQLFVSIVSIVLSIALIGLVSVLVRTLLQMRDQMSRQQWHLDGMSSKL